jgi:hypothetical protein
MQSEIWEVQDKNKKRERKGVCKQEYLLGFAQGEFAGSPSKKKKKLRN